MEARDIIVPVLTFLGGIVGVIVGGLISRVTLLRAERERGAREREMAWTRIEWEWKSERRRGLGAVRVLIRGLQQQLEMVESVRVEAAWPAAALAFALRLPEGQEQLVSTWLSDEAWTFVNDALTRLLDLDRDRQPGLKADDDWVAANMIQAQDALVDAIDICRKELLFLEGQLDNAPANERGHASWPPSELPEPPVRPSTA
jgi:hypothetical protein